MSTNRLPIQRKRLIIVTDLDATLLTHTYAWEDAKPAIEALREQKIPLVLNSSKTVAEMQSLAAELDLDSPLIAENGGLIAVPQSINAHEPSKGADNVNSSYSIKILGRSRKELLDAAHKLRKQEGFRFQGFADWAIDEIADHTGLDPASARRAGDRKATEPLIWEDSEERRLLFEESLKPYDIRMLKGGRFWHLMGEADKADGVQTVADYYKKQFDASKVVVVALGDSPNDLKMLEAADIAVVIPHDDGPKLQPKNADTRYATSPSSKGWNIEVLKILEQYKR